MKEFRALVDEICEEFYKAKWRSVGAEDEACVCHLTLAYMIHKLTTPVIEDSEDV